MPARAASGYSTDGSMYWTTDTNGIAQVPNAVTPSQGFVNGTNGFSANNSAGDTTYGTSSQCCTGYQPVGGQYNSAMYRPNGTSETTGFENGSDPGFGNFGVIFATPAKFFGGLINTPQTADTISFYSGNTVTLTLNISQNASYLPGPRQYAEYLNVSALGAQTITKVEIDYYASGWTRLAELTHSTSGIPGFTDASPVDEPPLGGAMLAVGMLGALGVRARFGRTRR